MTYPKIKLRKEKGKSIQFKHPWIFSGAIDPSSDQTEEGELVTVEDSLGRFLATGYTQIGSIAVRILSFDEQEISDDFWLKKIQRAWALRQLSGLTSQSTICRLVFGESDGIPGLILDYYAGVVIYQAHTVFAYLIRQQIVEALQEVLGTALKAVYDKSSETLPKKAELTQENTLLYGELEDELIAEENGLRFKIDFKEGQKTGFFIDQRNNRQILEQYADGKKVLNLFCYTAGFSMYALRGGATLVHSVDSSAKAIALAEENAQLNFPNDSRHQSFTEDAFKYLENHAGDYDLIVLDPPAFAKHKKVLGNALKGYRRLNTIAFEIIKKGGLIFTFSCSQVVSLSDFRKTIFQAAATSGRTVTVLQQLIQPTDHPVSLFHPESEYLKGFILWVE